MEYAFFPREIVSSPISGSEAHFPINRIFCVGRNYSAHIAEMGLDPAREPPFYFAKDADAYVGDGAIIPYPSATSDFQHEIELVVAIGKAGSDVSVEQALSLVFGYAIGLDMTRRDLQVAARKVGRPWTTGKNFPYSAPMGPIHLAKDVGEISDGAINLSVNGVTRQASDLGKMVWSVREAVSQLSALYPLRPGDLLFTGTPDGIGPVVPGDVMVGSIDGLGSITVTVGR